MEKYQRCTRCVMDTSARNIVFNKEGVCNYCEEFLAKKQDIVFMHDDKRKEKRDAFVEKVRREGSGKRYDCIVGLSGGVDSAWSLYLAKKAGLRPLAVHMDNGWNSELAQNNIKNIVGRLGVDLHTHVIDWQEYRDMMEAFFAADVIDVELLYDNAMLAVNYKMAAKWGVKYILSGSNSATEGMRIPSNWTWFKYDKRNIKSIHAKFGRLKRIKTFPSFGTFDFVWSEYVRRVRWISFLDYYAYRKQEALDVLREEFGYKPYPYKHYESVFTRFYQGYLLPEKFGVDKRLIHLSTLVMSEQMKRDDALKMLTHIPYPNDQDRQADINYFLKKMGWDRERLDCYLNREEKPHVMYGSEKAIWDFAKKIYFNFRGSE